MSIMRRLGHRQRLATLVLATCLFVFLITPQLRTSLYRASDAEKAYKWLSQAGKTNTTLEGGLVDSDASRWADVDPAVSQSGAEAKASSTPVYPPLDELIGKPSGKGGSPSSAVVARPLQTEDAMSGKDKWLKTEQVQSAPLSSPDVGSNGKDGKDVKDSKDTQDTKDAKDTKGASEEKKGSDSKASASTKSSSLSPECAFLADFDNKDDVVIIVKTGATEAFSKIPTQLLTFLSCASPDRFFLFSDLEQYIGTYQIHDSLDAVASNAKEGNSDFDLYNKQIEYKAQGQDIRLIANDEKDRAWNLDKYKNTHIARKAWKYQPEVKWYLFIDADTYVVWSSLLHAIKRLNPDEELYMGSIAMLGGTPFAHGGSGYLLSRASLQAFISTDTVESKIKWDLEAKNDCCGDLVMAKALSDIGVNVSSLWPMFNGERPSTMPFGPSSWCQPIITMHHMASEEVSDMWQLEQHRKDIREPLLIEELNEAVMGVNMNASRMDWDNFSDDRVYRTPDVKPDDRQRAWWELTELEKKAHKSFEDCGNICKEDKGCYQWSYHEQSSSEDKFEPGVCRVSWSFKVGERATKKEGITIQSGWNVENIAKFRAEKSPCKEPQWVDLNDEQKKKEVDAARIEGEKARQELEEKIRKEAADNTAKWEKEAEEQKKVEEAKTQADEKSTGSEENKGSKDSYDDKSNPVPV